MSERVVRGALCVLVWSLCPLAQAQIDEPEVPRDPSLREVLQGYPSHYEIRECVGHRSGEWTITIDASAGALRRARVHVRDVATGRGDRALARCLQGRLRTLLGPMSLRHRPRGAHREEHTFVALDAAALERAYLERRRDRWTAAEERAAIAACLAPAPASRFPLRIPMRLSREGGPFVHWPQPPPSWWVAERELRACLEHWIGGVPHIGQLPFEHFFDVVVERDGRVRIASAP